MTNDTTDIIPKSNLTYDDLITIFSKDYNVNEIGKTTQPSAIAVGDVKEISLRKISPMEIEKYLWLHPAIPRGIQIKANRMTERGYNIKGIHKDAVEYCENILKNSGGSTTINQWIQDSYGFGDGYRTLVPNKEKNEILKISAEHPIYFDISRVKPKSNKDDKNNSYKYTDLNYNISNKTKTPESYTQLEWDNSLREYKPIGEPIDSSYVAHLMFDKWGDEVKGISLVQYIHLAIKYLLNMEEAAAETIWRNGFTQKKVTTNIRTEKDLRIMASNLTSLRSRDVVILPDGSDVQNLVPGTSEFPAFHSVFMELIAIRLGIPKSLLLMDGNNSNKACYSNDTEILTDDGWKYHWELNDNTLLMQYNPINSYGELVKHNGIYRYKINEEMYNLKNKSNDIFVTNNHRMFIRKNLKKNYEIEKIENINCSRIKVKSSIDWNGKNVNYVLIKGAKSKTNKKYNNNINIDIDDYVEFLGYYLSEGGCSFEPLKENGKKSYGITFCQKNDNDKMKDFFNRFEKKYKFKISKYKHTQSDATMFEFSNKQLWMHLYNDNLIKYCYEKSIPSWVKNLPKKQLKILLKALIYGDGSILEKSYVYYTTSKQLADDVQEIAFKCGYSPTVNLHYENTEKSGKFVSNGYKRNYDGWRVFISKHDEISIQKNQIKKIKYNGIVWCPSVPSGLIITRRNGKIAIQGNTLNEMRKDMRADLSMDELIVKQVIEEQIFKPACKLKYGDEFEDFPEFNFNIVQTEKDNIIQQIKDTSTYVVQLVNSVNILQTMGRDKEANKILDYLMKSIDEGYKLGKRKEMEDDKNGKDDNRNPKSEPEQIPVENTRIPPAFKKLKAGDDTKD